MNTPPRPQRRERSSAGLLLVLPAVLICWCGLELMIEDPAPLTGISRDAIIGPPSPSSATADASDAISGKTPAMEVTSEKAAGGMRSPDIRWLLAELAIDKHDNDRSHAEWQRLLRQWGATDPQAAASWAQSLPFSEMESRKEAMDCVLVAWANADLPAVAGWVSNWEGGSERDAAFTIIAYEGARTNPVAAVQMASSLPSNPETWNLVGYAVSQWAATDPVAAWQWAWQIEDAGTRGALLSAVAVTWAASDPEKASRAIQEVPPGRSQDDAIVGIAQHWVQSDPEAATKWLDQTVCSPEGRAGARQAMTAISNHLHGR